MKTHNCIKVDTRGKSQYHWEDLLLEKQRARLNKLLTQMQINPWTQRKIQSAFKQQVKRDNIIPLYNHPIKNFLYALINNQLSDLENFSEIEIRTKNH